MPPVCVQVRPYTIYTYTGSVRRTVVAASRPSSSRATRESPRVAVKSPEAAEAALSGVSSHASVICMTDVIVWRAAIG